MDDLFLEGEPDAPFVGQRCTGHCPTLVETADELILGDEHLVEEHLVELRPAGELLDGVVEIAFIDFARLLRAETVSVNLLGLEFPLTPSQREALWAFAELVLPAGR